MTREPGPRLPGSNQVRRFRSVNSRGLWKAGLDLGRHSTILQEASVRPKKCPVGSTSLLPSLITRGVDGAVTGEEVEFTIGAAAATMRDRQEILSPLQTAPPRRAELLIGFARSLREQLGRRWLGSPWGVVACPFGADADVRRELQAMAGEIFERVLVVDEPTLFALGLLADPRHQHALVVDIRATSVCASVVGGWQDSRRDLPRNITVDGGGALVDRELRSLLLKTYPDLALTDLTVSRLKNRFSFVPPRKRTARVKVKLGESCQVLDITKIIQRVCESTVEMVMTAVCRALIRTPRELFPEVLANIFLVGGGALTAGLPERIQLEIRAKGVPNAKVKLPKDPQEVLAMAALKMAYLTPDDQWETPLFRFGTAG